MKRGGERRGFDFRRAAPGAALVLFALVAYLPAMQGGFVWDDDSYVTENRALRDLAGLKRVWLTPNETPQYYPLTHTTFWIEAQLFGLDPTPFHVTNVLLHAASAVLLWLLLRTLAVPGAWLAAAIFALHPVHVESVAWITERKNVLSGVFYFAAALVFVRHAARGGRGAKGPAIAFALFVCALLSKTVTASLPIALAIVLGWRYGKVERRHLPWLGAMLVVGGAMGRVTAALEVAQVGARGADFDHSILERVLIAGRVFWFYLAKLVYPADLAFVYPRWTIDTGNPGQWVFPAAVALFFPALWLLRRRIGAGPLAAFLFYGFTLAPASGFFDVFPMKYSFVADHFVYLASLGPIVLAAAAASRALDRAGGWRPALARALPVLVLLPLGALTWRQGRDYRDLETLWRATIEVNPKAWMAQYNLGKLLADAGKKEEAERRYRLALEAKPDLVEAWTNLANLLSDEGKTDEAIAAYERALASDPGYAPALYNLGVALQEAGRLDEAAEVYGRAARAGPDFAATAHNNRAVVLYHLGRYREAWADAEAAYRLGQAPHPDFLRALAERHPPPGRAPVR